LQEAKGNLKDYRENVDYPVWIEKHRERLWLYAWICLLYLRKEIHRMGQ
jgi:hypothetical protein